MIEWSDKLSVHIEEIDIQHKKLLSIINSLHDAMKAKKGKEIIGHIISELFDYAATHFKTEEKYLRAYSYPYLESHRQEHIQFSTKIAEFKSRFEKKDLTLTVEIMFFLNNWLLNHFFKTDKQYAKYFQEKGISFDS